MACKETQTSSVTTRSAACQSRLDNMHTTAGLTTHQISVSVIWFEIGSASLDVPAAEIAHPNSTAYQSEKGVVSANSSVG